MARALLIAVLIAVACSGSIVAEADPYSARVDGLTVNAPDMTYWTYTAFNTSLDANYYIYQVQVSVDPEAYVIDATGPTGWDTNFEHVQLDHYVYWMCPTRAERLDSDPAYYLEQGAWLSDFAVTYDRTPTSQEWTAGFGNLLDDDERGTATGYVCALEPGSLSGAIAGLVMFGALAKRRTRMT